MAEIFVDVDVLASCKGRIVVIAGGANGIGAATAARFFHSGAHVFVSDYDDKGGIALKQSLKESATSNSGSCHFTQVNVTDYQAQVALFDLAYKKHGQVDYAVYCAGVNEMAAGGSIMSPENTIDKVKEYPKALMDLIDINLSGCIYFARIALSYLGEGSDKTQPPSKGLTMISSAAAFQEAPGMPGYAASKAGILAMMRAMRAGLPTMCSARVNAICPWATETAMTRSHNSLFKDNDIPLQGPDDVAKFIQQVTVDPKLNGRGVYVGAYRAFDIEEGLDRTLPQWLGQVNVDLWNKQAVAFSKAAR
ncbi:hypothetical protein DL95DRAFT_348940 [Leptodontidium sp. 2 PMI_412]|nr:hypothetical protein DL95DRAFT_348940 [Leptodontidium sp. 2 PMI_412]